MNIVIAGKNNIAIDVASYIIEKMPQHKVLAVINRTDNGSDGFQRSYGKYCDQVGIRIISLCDAYLLEDSVFLSLEFDQIVKPEMFRHDKIYNIHFSLLPKYKGMYTSAWPIINGEEKSGVTFHKIDRGIDTGDIIDQVEFNLDENETAKSLYLKYIYYGTSLVVKYVEAIISGQLSTTVQSYQQSSYYSKKSIDYSNVTIDFNKTAYEVFNQIKAFTFRDYQLPKIDTHSIFGGKILECKSNVRPGSLVREDDTGLVFSTIDYDLWLYKDAFESMLEACASGDIGLIERLSDNILLINEKNKKGWSPIIVAAYYGHVKAVKLLISKGALINDRNNNGTSVLMYAKDYLERTGDRSFVHEIIALGGDINIKDYRNLTVKDYVVLNGNHYSKSFFQSF